MEHKNNVREHFYCVKAMFDLYKTKDQLQALSSRQDLDSVCAFDLLRMKNNAIGGGLNYADFNPEIKGITVPKLE